LIFTITALSTGPTTGWNISSGSVVSDSFHLDFQTGIGGLSFADWVLPGDIAQSVEISITSSEFGGTTYFDQTLDVTQFGCVLNQYGYNVCTLTGFFFFSPTFNAGTYWLNLQNATGTTGDPIYWDENSGPSLASEDSIGTIPSESFTLYQGGSDIGVGPGSAAEPSSIMLFGSGVLALAGILRRKLF